MSPEQELRLAALMRRAQTGNETAYAELLIALAVRARRFVRGQVGTVPWADDAVQTTLLSVDRSRQDVEYTMRARLLLADRYVRAGRTDQAAQQYRIVAASSPRPTQVEAATAFLAATRPR